MNQDDYKAKIQKILALIDGAKTEGEARAASLALQRLLAKTGLTLADVEEAEEAKQEALHMKGTRFASAIPAWKVSLANVIAENYRCRTGIRYSGYPGARRKRVEFIGMGEDAEVAAGCYRATVSCAQRLLRRWAAAQRKRGLVDSKLCTYEKNSYYLGFVDGLKQAYEEQKRGDETMALALAVPAEVNHFMDQAAHKPYRAGRVTVSTDPRFEQAGREDGHAFGAGTSFDDPQTAQEACCA